MSLRKQKLNILSLMIIGLSVMAWSGAGYVQADSDEACDLYYTNRDSLVSEIFEEGNNDPHVSFPSIFKGTPKKPKIENLYVSIYKDLRQTPTDEALRNTADRYQYSQTEMCGILGGSFDIIARTTEGNQDALEIAGILIDIQDTYNEELTKAEREQQMYLDSYSKEIFANGDIGDSSFDVLYDLEIIEYILFGESGYATGTGGGLSTDDDSDSGEGTDEGEDGISSEETSVDLGLGEEEEGTESGEDGAEDSGEEESEDDYVNPVSCIADDALQTALEDYSTYDPGSEEADDGSADEDGEDGADDGDPDDGDADGSSGDSDVEEESPIIAATPSDWSRPTLCNSVFCLFVRFVNNPESSYQESDNCIKCHIEYIVDALDETVSKSLVPGKASGNLMEPSVCKDELVVSLTKIDMNLILIPVPISTPPAEDLITGLNFCDNIDDFVKDEDENDVLLSALFKNKCGEDADIPTELTETELFDLRQFGEGLDNAVKEAETRSDSSTSLDVILESALATYADRTASFEAAFKNSRTTTQMSTQTEFFQSMTYEMDQMNNYFRSFYESISMTQETAKELESQL